MAVWKGDGTERGNCRPELETSISIGIPKAIMDALSNIGTKESIRALAMGAGGSYVWRGLRWRARSLQRWHCAKSFVVEIPGSPGRWSPHTGV